MSDATDMSPVAIAARLAELRALYALSCSLLKARRVIAPPPPRPPTSEPGPQNVK